MNNPQFQTASIKVMRSYDYCHFEVCLSSSASTPEEVDSLRKTAAVMVDKAVAQYKLAKENASRIERDTYLLDRIRYRAADIDKKPEADRTPTEKAIMKKAEDFAHWARREYDYDDEFEEDPDFDASIPGDDEVHF